MINNILSKKNVIRSAFNLLRSCNDKSHQCKRILHKNVYFLSQKFKDSKQSLEQVHQLKVKAAVKKSKNQQQIKMTEYENEFEGQNREIIVLKNRQKGSKQVNQFFNLDQEGKLNSIEKLKEKQKIKQLSMIAHQLLFDQDKSSAQIIWCALQEAFISLLEPTKDQNRIRSLSKFLYSLGKSKRATHNYQTQVALLLPFSSNQSFTQIITTISRMGGMSQEFSHIVEKLYWKRKEQFSALQMNLINYVLAKNGKKIDTQLVQMTDKFPLRSIVMMLRSYDMADMMTPQILKKCIPEIASRKRQTNFLDFRGIFSIYCKYLYLDNQKLINYFEEQYKILARNVNQEALEEVWQFFPKAVNSNKLPIALVEQIIKSLKILKIRSQIGERTWKKIALSFKEFQNLQIRIQLQKI